METDQIGVTFRGGELGPPSVEHLASLPRLFTFGFLQNQRVYSGYFSKKTREGRPEPTMLGGVTLIFVIFSKTLSKIERGGCTL